MPDLATLTQARAALAAARANRDALLAQVASAAQQGQQLARTLPPNDNRLTAFKEREQSLNAQLSDSHASVRSAQDALNQQIGSYLGQGGSDFIGLSGDEPIALFPVRCGKTELNLHPYSWSVGWQVKQPANSTVCKYLSMSNFAI